MKLYFKRRWPRKPKNIDRLISEKFKASYLNNTKWYKLIDGLTNKFNVIHIDYKLIYEDKVEGILFDMTD